MSEESTGARRPDWAWPEGIWPESAWEPGWDEPLEEWDGDHEAEVSAAGPEDSLDLDLLRWTWSPDGSEGLPGPEEVLRGLYRKLEPDPQESTLGAYLCAEETETYRVASGTTSGYAWVADRYQLRVRPRKEPWTVLRDSADEVQRVHLAEILDGVILEHWRSGARVRQVQLDLSDRPVSRGELQDFERPVWDGKVPRSSGEVAFREVPPDQRIDIEALIATEPPEHLEVQEDGTRLLYLTPPRSFEIIHALPSGRGYGSGFQSDGGLGTEDDPDIFRHFLNLDTLNTIAVSSDEEEWWVDTEALVRAALQEWFGLAGSRCSWDWPCQVWTVR